MQEFGDAVQQCAHCDGIVIDLRGNPGGIGAMAMGMAGWLVKQTGERLGVMYMRGATLNFFINPRAEAFEGPVAVLVDGSSASTSEIFAGGLKDLGRARIFGTRTAAAALPSVITRLPNGDGFQYAVANYISQGGKALEGNGVVPDVEVKLTREALLAGHDTVVDAALDWIRKQRYRNDPILQAYCSGAFAGAFAAAQPLPKAETILDRYSEVTGGKAAYQKHTHETHDGNHLLSGAGIGRQAHTLCHGPRQRIFGPGTGADRQD